MELMSTNFNIRTSHETSCCEIRSCLLSEDQRASRLDVCCEMKDQLKTDPDFLSIIVTFFHVSKNEEGPERKAFSECRGGEGENDGGTEGFHFARVPELF